MAAGILTIDLDAVAANWRALDALSAAGVATGAVVKADGYGLGAARVAARLGREGVSRFYVAVAAEGAALRRALGPEPEILVFSGYMAGDGPDYAAFDLIPLLNSPDQVRRFRADHPGRRYGLQLDSGMNRLGLEASDLPAVADAEPVLVMSHLANADAPDHPGNAGQLAQFRAMADRFPGVPRSLAATGGILLGPDFHFDAVRAGVGLYGGLPFAAARPVVTLDLPVIQVRDVAAGEAVGYGSAWTAPRDSRIATVSAGYADGLIRAMGRGVTLWHGDAPCPLAGRVSMDLLTVDVTGLPRDPEALTLIGPRQGVDAVAAAAGTIGYEILTSLGHRYERVYKGV